MTATRSTLGMTAPSLEQRRVLRTEVPGPRSQELASRKAAAVSAAVGTALPAFIARAEGAILQDVDGNQLIDFGAGIAVMNVGHTAPAVVHGVRQQVADLTHSCFMVTPYEGYVAVAERINALTPGTHEKRTALFNSGAEAVENAVKIARSATGRSAVVAFDHAYHGRTNLTMALTAKSMPYKHGFGPFASDVYRAPMSYPFREPTAITGEQAAARAIDVIEKQVGATQTAAVLIEPIQGEGGFVVPARGFLPTLAQWCRDRGVVLIADEIQTGFCRTGDWFACNDEDVVPDLMTLAKGIAGGLPLAAVTGRAKLMDSPHVGGLGGTYGGNPVTCAAAIGALDTMAGEDLCGRAQALHARAWPRLQALAAADPRIGDVRGRGAMLAVELVRPGTMEPDAESTGAINRLCHSQGLVTLTAGTYGNVFRLLPPLTISDELLDEGLSILEESFAATRA
jgi:4-aminobutyrate aminotransferase/(S)-3-amino-2-methylpropionate transaminase